MRRTERGLAEIALAPAILSMVSGLVMCWWWGGALWKQSALAAAGLWIATFVTGQAGVVAVAFSVDSPGTPEPVTMLGGFGVIWLHVRALSWLDAPGYQASFDDAALAVLAPIGGLIVVGAIRKLIVVALSRGGDQPPEPPDSPDASAADSAASGL